MTTILVENVFDPSLLFNDNAGRDVMPVTPEAQSVEKNDIPDGGLTAWIQCAGCFVLFFNSWGIVNAFGDFQTYYMQDLLHNESSSTIAWIGSLQLALLGLAGLATGQLFDFGYLRSLVIVGHFFIIFGMMMTSLATSFWQILLAQGLVVGLGNCCLFSSAVSLLPTYFSSRRALVMGIAATGASFGGIIYSIVFQQLQPIVGFGWATRVIAFIAFAISALPICGLRNRIEPTTRRRMFDMSAFQDPTFVFFEIGQFLFFLGIYVPYFFVTSLTLDKVPSAAYLSAWLVPIINAGSLIGRIIPGYIADKIGVLNTLIPATILTFILAYAWIAVNTTAGILIFTAFYGFFSGASATLGSTALASICPDLEIIGVRMGMYLTIAFIGALVGNPIAGAILSISDDVQGLQLFCGTSIAIATIFLVLARWKFVGADLRIKA